MFVRVTSYVLYFILFFHCDLHNPSKISPIHTMIHSFCTSYSSKYCFPYTMILIDIPCSICMFIKYTVLLSLFLHFTNQSLQIIDFFLPFVPSQACSSPSISMIMLTESYFMECCSLSYIHNR